MDEAAVSLEYHMRMHFILSARRNIGAVRPVIPKRGEKDFEPAPGGGSGLQVHVLDQARAAMFDALKADRAISRYISIEVVLGD